MTYDPKYRYNCPVTAHLYQATKIIDKKLSNGIQPDEIFNTLHYAYDLLDEARVMLMGNDYNIDLFEIEELDDTQSYLHNNSSVLSKINSAIEVIRNGLSGDEDKLPLDIKKVYLKVKKRAKLARYMITGEEY